MKDVVGYATSFLFYYFVYIFWVYYLSFLVLHQMTFYEKYKQLQNEAFLSKLLTHTVYSTMCLENQEVSKSKVKEIVLSALEEQQLKGFQFLPNQAVK
jgi:hypothetical protein